MSDKLCIDLCSGLGGFSRAFRDAGWEVVTVDIDPKFESTVCCDITQLKLFDLQRLGRFKSLDEYSVVVVLASPPCTAFSKANATKWLKGIGDGLRVAAGCTDLIYSIMVNRGTDKTFFAIENPTGRLRWFMGNPESVVKLGNYGKPTWKPTNFWHNIPFKMLEGDVPPTGKHHSQRRQIHLSDLERNPAKRAEMPYGLGQAVLEAVEKVA